MKYNESNKPLVCMQTQSTCYKGTSKMKPLGVLWHSTGANNSSLKRYVQPSDIRPAEDTYSKVEWLNLLGKNQYNNDWNHVDVRAGLNAWIGKLVDGTVTSVQAMPWDYKPWGCGAGDRGSCNNGWMQFEICEDNLNNKNYFEAVYKEACELTAYYCKMYNLDPKGTVQFNGVTVPVILCHYDSCLLGLGSNHGDVYHWFKKYNKTMEDVRNDVAKLMELESEVKPEVKPEAPKSEAKGLAVGDVVSIANNATYYGGQAIPDWVKNQRWIVLDIQGDRIVIDKSENGKHSIMSPIHKKHLTSDSIVVEEKPVKKELAAGDVVSIAEGAVYYGGQSIPGWVKNQKWIVHSLSGDRVIIDKSENGKHSIMSPINKKYLISDAVQEAPAEEFVPYLGKVTVDALNYRQGPGLDYKINGTIKKNEVYTIVDENGDWGKLKSGAGWVHLEYIQKI